MNDFAHPAAHAKLPVSECDNLRHLNVVRHLANALANRLSAAERIRAWFIGSISADVEAKRDPERALYALRAAAHAANRLAKDVTDESKAELAYQIKNVCLSALVRSNRVTVNHVDSCGCTSLDILLSPRSRLHTFLEKLQPDAAMIVRSQLGIIPITASLSDHLPHVLLETLKNFPTNRRFAA